MRIVYFYQYFSTPKGAWGTRVYDFAKNWVEKGHSVTIITSVYSKSDIKAKKFIETQYFDGIEVKIINISIDNKQPILKRIWTFIQYSMISSYFAMTENADIFICSSGPISVGLPGLLAHYLRNKKLVFETRDLWPDGAIEMGLLKSKILQKLCYWFEKKCYKASSYIITLSPGMTINIKNRFNLVNINDVTNGANIPLFSTPVKFDFAYVLKKSYAIYTGNIGIINNSYWLYKTAEILKNKGRSDIKILLIGDGPLKCELFEKANQHGIDNLIFLPLMPKDKLVGYIQNALVSLVPLDSAPILSTSSPNKLFESIAAGIPIIQNTEGWIKDLLDTYEIGFTLNPNDPYELSDCLINLFDYPERLIQMNVRCFEVAKKLFDKDVLSDKMLDILKLVHAKR